MTKVKKITRRLIARKLSKGFAAGVIGGLAASVVMNQFQKTLGKLFGEDEKPHGAQSLQAGSPQHGAGAELRKMGLDNPDDNAAERTANIVAAKLLDRRLSEDEKHVAGAVAHYAFGASAGAVYGVSAEVVSEITAGAGLPFGAAVWLMADEGVVPAFGLSKLPTDYPLSKHAYALASHLVYGLTTDLVRKAVRRAL